MSLTIQPPPKALRWNDGMDSPFLLAHAVRGCLSFGVEVSTDQLRGGIQNECYYRCCGSGKERLPTGRC